MNLTQYLLTKLAEEASEVAKAALKASQFGLDEVYERAQESNAKRLHDELNDLLAIILMLNDIELGYVVDFNAIDAKQDKVEKWANYSESLGLLIQEDNKE